MGTEGFKKEFLIQFSLVKVVLYTSFATTKSELANKKFTNLLLSIASNRVPVWLDRMHKPGHFSPIAHFPIPHEPLSGQHRARAPITRLQETNQFIDMVMANPPTPRPITDELYAQGGVRSIRECKAEGVGNPRTRGGAIFQVTADVCICFVSYVYTI